MPATITYAEDTLSLPPRLAAHRAQRRRQDRQDTRPATRRVIVGYTAEPSPTARAQDGTPLYDPIVRELEPGVFAGLREVAAGICGMQVHQVVELPEGTPQSQIPRLAEIVKEKRAGRRDLPPCCRVVKELGKREGPTS